MAKKPPPGFNTPFANIKPPKPEPAPEKKPPPPPAARPPSAKAVAKPAAPKETSKAAPPPPLSPDDQRAFEQAMYGVKPLAEAQRRQRAPAAEAPAPPPRKSRAASDDALARADLADLVQSHDRFTIDEVGETVSGVAPGIDRKLLHRLRGGDYPVEAELDLHRRSRAEAAAEVERFLARARAEGLRCILIIHGRGLNSGPEGPVLVAATRDWLTQGPLRRHVLAFTSAPPNLGGAGAMLILLRRSEK
jgi:DNA-nicking Smr family endonuclease